MTAREGLFYFPKGDKGASPFLLCGLESERQINFRAFRDFRGWRINWRNVACEPRNTRNTRKGFSREYVHLLFFWPFSASLSSFPAEAMEQELGCLCRMNKRALCGIMKRAEAPARPMICLAGFGSCLLRDMLQIM